jgi:hypothetical protein
MFLVMLIINRHTIGVPWLAANCHFMININSSVIIDRILL